MKLLVQLWFYLELVKVGLVLLLGVSMAKYARALRPDEMAVISAGWLNQLRFVRPGGRVFTWPGELVDVLSLRSRAVVSSVRQCPSQDRFPFDVRVQVSFRLINTDTAAFAFCDRFPAAEEARDGLIAAEVDRRIAGHLWAVVGTMLAEHLETRPDELTGRVRDRAGGELAALGLAVESVGLLAVVAPPGYVQERNRQRELAEQIGSAELDIQRQDMLHHARAQREANDLLVQQRARSDAEAYAEEVRLRAIRERQQVEAERLEMQREHDLAMARIKATELRLQYQLTSEYEQSLLRAKLVDQLPQIMGEQGRMLSGLQTYIDGSGGQGLAEVISGLAQFGLPVMKVVTDILGSGTAGIGTALAAGQPAHTPDRPWSESASDPA